MAAYIVNRTLSQMGLVQGIDYLYFDDSPNRQAHFVFRNGLALVVEQPNQFILAALESAGLRVVVLTERDIIRDPFKTLRAALKE